MNSNKVSVKKEAGKVWDNICADAAAQSKTPFIFLVEQSEGLRQMFIHWYKQDIEQLEKIKSLHE